VKFKDKLAAARLKNDSLLCVGLDPDPAQLPPGVSFADFNRAIVEATADLVCAFKPNLAFYEAAGTAGMAALEATLKAVPSHVTVIGDGKRGDIGNTSKAYAKALFEGMGFDAATVNPYLGFDSVQPFLEFTDKGVILLCRTSNPGGADFQDLVLADGRRLYEAVALKAVEWNKNDNIGLVAGATRPEELGRIRRLCPDLPILIPGVGAQGGDLKAVIDNGLDADSTRTIINVSRQVLYASKGKDFAPAARKAAEGLRAQIKALLPKKS
jgi:orotidine-5'-phosphate decarboxylase